MNHIRAMAVGAMLLAVGCGVSDAELGQAPGVGEEEGELGSGAQSYVVYRHDYRRCVAPACGGYWVHDVNRAVLREVYVSALDLTAAHLDEATEQAVRTGGEGEVVLRGKLGPVEPRFQTRTFLVTEAWRGMPGVTVAPGSTFYRVAAANIQCFAAPCPSMKATKLNATATTLLTQVDVADAAKPHVQQSWLESRLASHDAVAAGVVVRRTSTVGPAPETVLDASQVFVKLPERVGPCPAMPTVMCTGGKVPSNSRTPDRCLVQTACVNPGMCPPVMLVCEAGYRAVQWRGGSAGCLQWACDPDFLP